MAKKKKAKARAKAKAKARVKAKAKARVKAKAKPRASAKPRAKAKPSVQPKREPVILDEVLEEPLLDASGILRVKDQVARERRDVDEDELKQFSDPSLVVDVVVVEEPSLGGEDSQLDLPDLFADEVRRQKQRLRDAGATPAPDDRSLFGALGKPDPKK